MPLGTIDETCQKKIGMRSPQKSNRPRGRGNRKPGGGGNINRVYESAGPEGKVRGTAQQIIDKYLSLARDAQTAGDRVNAENFLQHAEHYQRILALALGQQQERREQAQSDEDDGSSEAESRDQQQQDEREERPVRAERPRREKSAAAGVDGMQTIDADEGENGPDLLVTEEAGPRNRRRRSAPARSKSENNEDTAAESAAE